MACSAPDTRVQRTQVQLLYVSAGEEPSPLAQSLTQLAGQAGYGLQVATDSSWIDEDSLAPVGVLILEEVKGADLTPRQRRDLERYVAAGNGLICLDCELENRYSWAWLAQVKAQAGQLPAVQPVRDEQGTTGWSRLTLDAGRVVWASSTGLSRAEIQAALQEAISFALGDNSYDYGRVDRPRAPRTDRFTRLVLDDYDVNEPMELAVMPDGKVIFIERRGKMKLYDPETEATRLLATFDVCVEGNYEDGLLGLTLDPDFANNGYLYLYYSPGSACARPQTLSRFTMYKDSLILASEKVILEVEVQRETCCHSGGSITFGPDGNLYLSTGDNTSSKESDGYTPIDERPGRGPFDAQKSSANTHDLRGKVLRIRPTAFGTYKIPEGNLFPKDGSQGRPEIYTMGCRNPFRISVDAKTGYLYWGDVGPDVGVDGRYGPQSYDEWNQARQAGNYGWPYFVADNQAYPDRDFAVDTVGPYFDAAHPVNASPNNTGSRVLPPAQPAFIWYPYRESDSFPMLGVGSRSAMAGPVYYQDQYPAGSDVRFPKYYDGKLFIYEWARSWIKVVTMDEAGHLAQIEDFLPDMPLSKPIDIEFGPDGAMYMLEYGQNYFMNNPEARLVKIEYAAGNRLPLPTASVDQAEGSAPHTAHFSAAGSFDYDVEDSVLQYLWYFTDSLQPQATGEAVSYTFAENGTYTPILAVVDAAGDTARTRLSVRVGNAPPQLEIDFAGNRSFFFGGTPVDYRVNITDPEDEASGGLSAARTQVSWVYAADGNDLQVLLGEGGSLPEGSLLYLDGLRLINNSDCKSCHNLDVKSIGPSYREVSRHYLGDAGAVEYLAHKIITGGNGVWGEKIMAGHPQHSLEETRAMARYILSLAESQRDRNLPSRGQVRPARQAQPGGAYLLAATYTDGGAAGLPPATRRVLLPLRYPRIEAESFQAGAYAWMGKYGPNRETGVVQGLQGGAWIDLGEIDWSYLGGMRLRYLPRAGGALELRLDAPDGPLLGSVRLPAGSGDTFVEQTIRWRPIEGMHRLFLVCPGPGEAGRAILDYLEPLPATEH